MIRTIRTWLAKPSRTTHQSIGQALFWDGIVDGVLNGLRKHQAAKKLDTRFAELERRLLNLELDKTLQGEIAKACQAERRDLEKRLGIPSERSKADRLDRERGL